MRDMNGAELKKGDKVNVFYTSHEGEYNHDLVCEVKQGIFGDIQLEPPGLLWESEAHNQNPTESIFCIEYGTLCEDYKNRGALAIPDTWNENHFHRNRWKSMDYSSYILKIDD